MIVGEIKERHAMRILLALLATSALLTACGDRDVRVAETKDVEGGPLKVVTDLQCPAMQGQLTRKGTVSPDGLTCTYLGPRGSEVVLAMVKLDKMTADAVLARYEADLKAQMPQIETGRNAVEVKANEGAGKGETARVRAPGVDIRADDASASVRIGPLRIEANDDNADVNLSSGGSALNVQASDGGAEIRTTEAGSGVRATYILASDDPSPRGLRHVGYVARGPSSGPLIIATIRSKDERNERGRGDNDSLMEDAEALVTLNVGE